MKNRSQLDLFVVTPESRGPLAGLAVRLPDVCRCGSDVAKIGSPVGPHLAELYCAHCERHRGWLPRVAHEFLAEVVNKFGRPTEPITIRRSGQQQPNISRVAGARRAQVPPVKQRRKGDVMDMREFRKPRFLKVEDCRDQLRQMRIAGCVPGKYSKPDLVFENGDRLGLSATNVEILSEAYGWESATWIGHLIELGVGRSKFDGEDIELIIVKPISKAEGSEQSEPVKKAPNKPSKSGADFDDEVAF